MEALALVEYLSTAGFKNSYLQKLTENARLFTLNASARFKLSGSSFLSTFLADSV